MSGRWWIGRVVMILFLTAAIPGCTSPEAARQRGGGPGADIGNRPAEVKMHEGSRQYYGTPVRIESESPSLAPSEQARRLSLPGSEESRPPNDGGQR